jgi:hypothetical protein
MYRFNPLQKFTNKVTFFLNLMIYAMHHKTDGFHCIVTKTNDLNYLRIPAHFAGIFLNFSTRIKTKRTDLRGENFKMKKIPYFLVVLFVGAALFTALSEKSFAGKNDDMTAEALVAAHVKSIGSPALLAKVQSRTFVGASNVDFVLGGTGNLKGNSMFVSKGSNLALALTYKDTNYPGEYFAYDGKEVTVKHIQPGQKSPIADFIFRFSKIMKGGFIGGTLSQSWPLLDIQNKNVDMKYRKTKVDGIERYELEYHPRDGFGDVKIRMYFDMTTFQHVRTEYTVRHRDDASVGNAATFDRYGDSASVKASGGGNMMMGQARPDSYYTLIEKFEDYKKVGGLMLPHRYILDYTMSGSGSFVANWTMNVIKWGFNAPNLDQKIFQAEK